MILLQVNILISINPEHQIYMDMIGCNDDPCLIVKLLVKWAWLALYEGQRVCHLSMERW